MVPLATCPLLAAPSIINYAFIRCPLPLNACGLGADSSRTGSGFDSYGNLLSRLHRCTNRLGGRTRGEEAGPFNTCSPWHHVELSFHFFHVVDLSCQALDKNLIAPYSERIMWQDTYTPKNTSDIYANGPILSWNLETTLSITILKYPGKQQVGKTWEKSLRITSFS